MKAALALVLVAAAVSVSGCASDQERWCDAVGKASPGLTKTIDAGGPANGLLDALPTLKELAGQAPDDVRRDWRTLVGALEDLDAAVEAKDKAAQEAASLKLASPEVRDAADAVEQEVQDVCGTILF